MLDESNDILLLVNDHGMMIKNLLDLWLVVDLLEFDKKDYSSVLGKVLCEHYSLLRINS